MDSLQVVSQTNDCSPKRPHEDQARSNVPRESDIMRVDHVDHVDHVDLYNMGRSPTQQPCLY